MALSLVVNGVEQRIESAHSGDSLVQVIQGLGVEPSRVAVELNGEIVRRANWGSAAVGAGDKLEIVHFVGGG
jgi:thiamine biosynthesis protein ThiS